MATTTKAPVKKAPAKKTAPRKAPIPEPINPWDRQLNETGVAYQAFQTYRDIGLTRSQTKVALQVGKSQALMERWSAKHSWALRAASWDREIDREHQLTQIESRRAASKRNAKIAQSAMNQVVKKLVTMTEKDLDANSMTRLMDVASKLERLALDESTENVQVSGPGGGPVQTADVTLLTDEERLSRMETLHRELTSRLHKAKEDDA